MGTEVPELPEVAPGATGHLGNREPLLGHFAGLEKKDPNYKIVKSSSQANILGTGDSSSSTFVRVSSLKIASYYGLFIFGDAGGSVICLLMCYYW